MEKDFFVSCSASHGMSSFRILCYRALPPFTPCRALYTFQPASRILREYQHCVRALRLESCSQAFNARAVYNDARLYIYGRDYIRAEARGHRRDTELVDAAFRLHRSTDDVSCIDGTRSQTTISLNFGLQQGGSGLEIHPKNEYSLPNWMRW